MILRPKRACSILAVSAIFFFDVLVVFLDLHQLLILLVFRRTLLHGINGLLNNSLKGTFVREPSVEPREKRDSCGEPLLWVLFVHDQDLLESALCESGVSHEHLPLREACRNRRSLNFALGKDRKHLNGLTQLVSMGHILFGSGYHFLIFLLEPHWRQIRLLSGEWRTIPSERWLSSSIFTCASLSIHRHWPWQILLGVVVWQDWAVLRCRILRSIKIASATDDRGIL